MCFENFLNYFNENISVNETYETVPCFLKAFSKREFNNGIFIVFDNGNIEKWNDVVLEMFPNIEEKFKLFAYDWLGRIYATNENETAILLFDPGTHDILFLDESFVDFINTTIPANAEDIFASKMFNKWIKKNKKLSYPNCVGYKVPLFLGGKDKIKNMEETDMEVYWSISAQIISQI